MGASVGVVDGPLFAVNRGRSQTKLFRDWIVTRVVDVLAPNA